MSYKKPYRNFKEREPSQTIEQKVESFIMRNSRSGFFTKVSTISYKFEVSEDKAWSIVGEVLSSGSFESTHDEYSGEMKLCEYGKKYAIMELERKRKKEKYKSKKQSTKK